LSPVAPRRRGRERAILAGRSTSRVDRGDSLTELRLLAETAGAQVLGEVLQRRGSVRSSTFLSKGKIEEIRTLGDEQKATLLLLDDDLSPAQNRNLEEELKLRVEYMLPRLTRMWEHLSRLGGGIGTRGPGETQLEVDRRRIRERIAKLKRELEGVVRERRVQRRGRKSCHKVSLVGYTNAGKSTLFNTLTRAKVYVEDQLFATLDPTTRVFAASQGTRALLTDTVGFIRKLPSHLVASFRATLEEVTEADLLVHVVDASEPDPERHMEAVHAVLEEIGALHRPRLLVFNMIDALPDEVAWLGLRARYPGAIFVSAMTREGIPELREAVLARLTEESRPARRVDGEDRET
jgi:GTP-binding protein HflX